MGRLAGVVGLRVSSVGASCEVRPGARADRPQPVKSSRSQTRRASMPWAWSEWREWTCARCMHIDVSSTEKSHTSGLSGAGVCLSGAGVVAGVCSVGACALRCSPIHQNRHGVLLFLRTHAVFMGLRVETAGVGSARICRVPFSPPWPRHGPCSSVPLAHLVVSFDESSYVVSSFCDM